METAPDIDQLASVAWSTGDQYAPYVEDLVALVADAVKTSLPDVPNDQVGAVLLVVADRLARADADLAHNLSATALTNTMSILGARLYGGDAD